MTPHFFLKCLTMKANTVYVKKSSTGSEEHLLHQRSLATQFVSPPVVIHQLHQPRLVTCEGKGEAQEGAGTPQHPRAGEGTAVPHPASSPPSGPGVRKATVLLPLAPAPPGTQPPTAGITIPTSQGGPGPRPPVSSSQGGGVPSISPLPGLIYRLMSYLCSVRTSAESPSRPPSLAAYSRQGRRQNRWPRCPACLPLRLLRKPPEGEGRQWRGHIHKS